MDAKHHILFGRLLFDLMQVLAFFTFYFYHYQSATKMKEGEHSSNHMTLAYT